MGTHASPHACPLEDVEGCGDLVSDPSTGADGDECGGKRWTGAETGAHRSPVRESERSRPLPWYAREGTVTRAAGGEVKRTRGTESEGKQQCAM